VQTCSKCHAQSPDSAVHCVQCLSNLSEWSETAVSLKRLQANPRINYVKIIVYDGCCPACREVEGAYAKEDAPKLPVEGCSHGLGCRCNYLPVLEEIYP
jgi:hypothetical protein